MTRPTSDEYQRTDDPALDRTGRPVSVTGINKPVSVSGTLESGTTRSYSIPISKEAYFAGIELPPEPGIAGGVRPAIPVITGPGRYLNRDGNMVTVTGRDERQPQDGWIWVGIAASGCPVSWDINGLNQQNRIPWFGDIVARASLKPAVSEITAAQHEDIVPPWLPTLLLGMGIGAALFALGMLGLVWLHK